MLAIGIAATASAWSAESTAVSASSTDLKLDEPTLEVTMPESPAEVGEEQDDWSSDPHPMEPTISIEGVQMPAVDINGNRQVPQARWQVHPHGRVAAVYDDNIFIQPDHKEADLILSPAIGLAVGFGDFKPQLEALRQSSDNVFRRWELDTQYSEQADVAGNFLFLDYTASPVFFLDHSSENTVNQDATAKAAWTFNKLRLSLDSRLQSGTVSDIDIGNRVQFTGVFGALQADYDLSDKTAFQARGSYNLNSYEDGIDSTEWMEANTLSYRITPKVNVGLGLTFGYLEVSDAPNQTYEQALLRASYQPSGKTTLNASAGVEFREISGVDTQIEPIFGLGASYAPFDGTLVTLDAVRRVENSALLVGQNYTLTAITGRIRQRLFGRFTANLEGGYQNAEYQRIFGAGNDVDREDNSVYVRPSVSFELTRWAEAGLFYLYRRNDSTLHSVNFTNNQLGFKINVLF